MGIELETNGHWIGNQWALDSGVMGVGFGGHARGAGLGWCGCGRKQVFAFGSAGALPGVGREKIKIPPCAMQGKYGILCEFSCLNRPL